MNAEELVEKLEPVLGKKAKKLYMAWMLGDKNDQRDIEQCLRALYIKHIQQSPTEKNVLLAPPPKNISFGEIRLGTTTYNKTTAHEFYLRTDELCQHIAVFGRTGSGKTNTVRLLLKEFIRNKKPFLIFDWKKDYSQMDFSTVFSGLGISSKDIHVLPVGKRNVNCLRLNPLKPPTNTDPEMWIKQICEVLTHAYMGGPGFESLLLEAINHCYERFGVYEGRNVFPTFLDVKEYLENKRCTGRQAQWMQSVKRTVDSLCFGGMNDTVNSAEPHDLAELLGKNVILELDALSNTDKTFLIETMLLWLHHHRLQNPPVEKVDNLIIIEEAHHLLRKHDGDEETLIESALREMRSLGIGIVIVDQMPSLISSVALANTYTTIALNVKTGQDVYALTQAMLLNKEQQEMLGMLPVGQAIVKLQDRYIRPFHIKIPLVDTGKRIIHYTPCEVSCRIPRIPQCKPYEARESCSDARVPPQINHASQPENHGAVLVPERSGRAPRAAAAGAAPGSAGQGAVSNEDVLLVDIARHPTSSVTDRYKRLGWTARRGNHYRQKLIKAGLIKPVTFAGVNAWLRLFEITNTGAEQLQKLGHPRPGGRAGGLEHQYWTEKIAEHYRCLGYKVEQEKMLNGHPIDIVATGNAERIAIEIETGKSNFGDNMKECCKNKRLTKIEFIATSERIATEMNKLADEMNDSRVKVKYGRHATMDVGE